MNDPSRLRAASPLPAAIGGAPASRRGATGGAIAGASHGATGGAPAGRIGGALGGAARAGAAPCLLALPGRPGAAHGAGASVARGEGRATALRPAPRPPIPTIDAETVIYRLEEAGRTLLALPQTGYTTRLRTSSLDYVRSALDGYGSDLSRGDAAPMRAAVPDSARIDRMDEAFGWITLLPRDRLVLRRIVGARSLVSPVTERHLFAWRRLAVVLGADHKAIQRWHAQGIDLIVKAVRAGVALD